MKKLLFLILISFVAFEISAQEIELPSSTTYFEFSTKEGSVNYSYYNYTGQSTDLLIPTTSDTIDVRFLVKKHRPYTLKTISKFNPIAGADTTVGIYLLGRNSDNESWTAITNATSAAVTTDGIVKSVNSATAPTFTATIAAYNAVFDARTATFIYDTTATWPNPASTSTIDSVLYSATLTLAADTMEVPQQTISLTQTSTLLEYRQILVRYIISGDDSVGTGIELVQLEVKTVEH